MHSVISPTEYRQRRDRLMAQLGQGTAIFASAPQAVMHNDVEYVFRQDSDFYYLTGFNEPEAIAVFAPATMSKSPITVADNCLNIKFSQRFQCQCNMILTLSPQGLLKFKVSPRP